MRLQGRIGINSGEVMAGDHLQGHLIVTGPAVTVAKRFEEAAAANEILISEATHRLVRDAVVVEPISHRAVKGGETLDAHAVVEVRPHTSGRARRFDTPLVDREQEFSALLNTFEKVVESRECHLLTVLGDAGVGKSRLVQEFAREVGAEATVLHGRCLPYGEGITYWPLADVVRDIVSSDGATDVEPSAEAIAALLPDEERAGLIADLISEALGLSGSVAGSEQTFWAVRKLFESLAQTRPLVVVFDDLQWAEPTFLDLVDYLADHTRDAPVLLLCLARPELFDIRRDWGGGKRHATTTSLEPLGDDDARRLDHEPARRPASSGRGADADRRARRGQRAVHRRAARDARRREAARAGRHALGRRRRSRGPARARRRSTRSSRRVWSACRRESTRCSCVGPSKARSFTTARSASSHPSCRNRRCSATSPRSSAAT